MKVVFKVEFCVEVDNVKDENQSLSDALADSGTTARIVSSDIRKVAKE